MAKIERIREVLVRSLDAEHLKQRTDAGWKLIALEWQREIEGEEAAHGPLAEEVPFGLKMAADCSHLEENVTEKQALMLMMDLIVDDQPLSRVADELNRQGFRTRQGTLWGPASVFNMLPRLIDIGPRIFSSEEWAARRRRLFRMSGGSPAGDRRIM